MQLTDVVSGSCYYLSNKTDGISTANEELKGNHSLFSFTLARQLSKQASLSPLVAGCGERDSMQTNSYCTPITGSASSSSSVEKRASTLRCEDLDRKFAASEERKLLRSPSYHKEGKTHHHHRRHLSPQCGSSSSSSAVTCDVEEDMNMKYADNTHHQLASSLAKINSISDNYHHHQQRSSPSPHGQVDSRSTDKRLPAVDRSSANQISRFDAVIRSKDYLLQEKDSLIVNLRLEKASLEHRMKEISARLYQQQNMEGSSGDNDRRPQQESTSKHNLRLLLVKTESELREKKLQMEKDRQMYDERLKKVTERCNMKDMQLEENNKKYRLASDQLIKYKKRTECLERYLGELPTREENDELKTQISQLTTERESLSLEIELLKDKLEKKIRKYNDKEFCLQKSLQVQTKQEEQIEELTRQVAEMEKLRLPLEASERQQFKGMKEEVERLQKEQVDMRKVMVTANNSAKHQNQRYQAEVKKLERKLYESRDEVESLRQEIQSKQQTSDKVNKEMISLTSQNQCFMEENMTLQDKVKTLKKKLNHRGEDHRLQGRLQNEITCTIHELKCVTQLLMQTMEGSEVNVSNLFSCGSIETANEVDTGLATPDSGTGGDISESDHHTTLERRLREVRNSRNDVDKLRTLISNKYADNIGDNCVTQ